MNASQAEDDLLHEELESGKRGLFRAKWTLDGATTLAEAAQKARDFANWLQGLHDEGYVLEDEITDDYGSYRKP